jgi:Ca2+-binding EF-hand superfamily protein
MRLCRFLSQLAKSASGIAHSVADGVLVKLQDAFDEGIASGRPFLGLCSLIDPKSIGKISRSELIHTLKMMTCIVTADDLDAVSEVLPNNIFTKDGDVNYKELNSALQVGITPRAELFPNKGTYHSVMTPATLPRQHQRTQVGALPQYATPRGTTRAATALFNTRSGAINTPAGFTIALPPQPRDSETKYDIRNRRAKPASSGESFTATVEIVWRKVIDAIELKSLNTGSNFSLIKQFSVYDFNDSGFVSTSTFQTTLDDIGVILSPQDLFALSAVYGDREIDAVDYEAFCKGMDEFISNVEMNTVRAGDVSWVTPRTIDRLRILRREGQNPIDILMVYDLDQTGLVRFFTLSIFNLIFFKHGRLTLKHL